MARHGTRRQRSLLIYTDDLRVRDHPALAAAVRESEQVVPAFVLDERLLSGTCGSPNRLAYLWDGLRDLDGELRRRGAGLVLRRGDWLAETMRLAARHRVTAIYMSAGSTPYATRRSELLREACASERIALRELPGGSVVAPGALTPAGGDHYRVFTPYLRAWSAAPLRPLAPTPRRIPAPAPLPALRLPALPAAPAPGCQPGGEQAARRRLERWVAGGLSQYEHRHDDLAGAATSRLSADLHFGCLSSLSVLARVSGRPGAEPFARQLCWRDFNRQVLAARPDIPHADYRPRGDRWRRDARGVQAWREGRTGFPIVDAGMRQLAVEGFMHNRARLVVGSFLTKLLYVDWRIGAAHFAALLQDADVANNVCNWQWVAGTGNETRPNRVLNPLRQARRFDPHGDYVRRHVPELAGVPGAAVHEPWRLPASQRRSLGYPRPILDHEAAARELRRRRSAYGSSWPS